MGSTFTAWWLRATDARFIGREVIYYSWDFMLIDKIIEMLRWWIWTQDSIIFIHILLIDIQNPSPNLGERTQFIFHKSFEEQILLKSNKKFSLFKLGKISNKFHIIREQMLSSSLVRFSSFILPHSLLSMSEDPHKWEAFRTKRGFI